jgi:hypothetical protein
MSTWARWGWRTLARNLSNLKRVHHVHQLFQWVARAFASSTVEAEQKLGGLQGDELPLSHLPASSAEGCPFGQSWWKRENERDAVSAGMLRTPAQWEELPRLCAAAWPAPEGADQQSG